MTMIGQTKHTEIDSAVLDAFARRKAVSPWVSTPILFLFWPIILLGVFVVGWDNRLRERRYRRELGKRGAVACMSDCLASARGTIVSDCISSGTYRTWYVRAPRVQAAAMVSGDDRASLGTTRFLIEDDGEVWDQVDPDPTKLSWREGHTLQLPVVSLIGKQIASTLLPEGMSVAEQVAAAKEWAEGGQYDAALDELFGLLEATPAELSVQQALREVALRRKLAGAPATSTWERPVTPLGRLIVAQKRLAYDPDNKELVQEALQASHALNESGRFDAVIIWLTGEQDRSTAR